MNMADQQAPTSNPAAENQEAKEKSLKYLGFVQVLTLQALIQAAKLYGFAKDKSGPLKPTVDTVEGTFKAVVGPVYEKHRSVPFDLLNFLDRKVDESVVKVQGRVLETAQKAPGAARRAYAKYEPLAEEYAVSAWHSLNRIPYVARFAVPTASYCSEMYNGVVTNAAEKGYKLATHLPLVPTERIAERLSELKSST